MAATEQIISVLEDTASLLNKAKINFSKCPKQRLTRGYIEARLRCIEEYWQTFKKTHEDLLRATTREQRGVLPYFLNEEYHIHEELYLCMQGDLKDMLGSIAPSSSRSPSAQRLSIPRDQPIKLPKIQITVFSGLYEEFPAFQDLFTSLVHNNATLSNVQKLHYLKTSLSGEAASLLKHIQVTDSNYTLAWNTLKHRYGNKRLIVNSLLKRLFTQKKINVKSASHIKSLLDTTSECLNSLKNLDVSTDSWDPIIIFLVVQKLDSESHKDWEAFAYKDNSEELPDWEALKKFLENTFRTLEMISPPSIFKERTTKTFHVATDDKSCVLCKEDHYLCHCKEFSKMQPTERCEYVKSNKLCYNCLVPGHAVSKCRIRMSCRVCHKRHHTLLHTSSKADTSASSSTVQPTVSALSNVEENKELQVHTMVASNSYSARQALLATALVGVVDDNGRTIMLRALIDPGSQASFLSEKATQFLKLTRKPAKRSVVGVGSTRTSINHAVQLNIISRCETNYTLPIEAFVMSKQLTTKIPTKALTYTDWPHIQNIQLADPNYCTPGSIDLLIGVKEYAEILLPELIKGPPGTPCAQNTKLGWILFGDVNTSVEPQECSFVVMHHQLDVDEILKSIWEIDIDNKRKHTKEENLCEEIYEKTHTRDEHGRYIVKLPFNTPNPKSPDGDTRERALHRFNLLEKRFNRTPGLREVYTKVIEEYIEMKHAEEVPAEDIHTKRSVYIPHLAVIREGKETTSTRVVFDASSKGSNGISLNDELLLGPLLQGDLRSLIMRWRMHAVCFVSDIEKMYRMILVAKEDADYQRFLWRNFNEPIKDYRLLTVTFGTASAPYLAIKTLMQLATDEGDKYPIAAKITKEDFYVDDVLSGFDTVYEAIHASQELKVLLQRGGFKLKKWSSNSAEFMKSIKPEERSSNVRLDMNIDGTTKALGILWNLKNDQFQYNSTAFEKYSTVTKRNILSDIQKLFDPLGWIAPLIVLAKILIQKLWIQRLDWDDEVNQLLRDEWITIKTDFENVSEVHIDRWLDTFDSDKGAIQIHGFSDASMQAYAAAVYCRVEKPNGTIQTHLIAAQTKIAPLKTVSLPRLELCGAVLLSKLLKHVSQAMRIPMCQIFAWTDSTIVISWLLGDPNRWKTFVANRVVEITENLNSNQWFHVQSHDNPADIASRGMLLKDLKDCRLWWKGPHWLSEADIQFVKPNAHETDLEMKKTIQVNLKIDKEDKGERIFTKQFENFDTLLQLLKTISLCKRFLNYKQLKDDINKTITPDELEKSLYICIIKVQTEDFAEEIEAIRRKRQVAKRSHLKSLNPYLDHEGILRVGGRLRHADLAEDNKHPIILSHTNKLSSLIVAEAHLKTLHGGIQIMMCYLRSKYWIIRGKSLVKTQLHRCLVCARQRATTRTQLMGDLPRARVTPSRAFSNSGVDFAGPFQVLTSKGKGMKTKKAYVAIFICMATKAIHIELVGDMTSEAFIGAFKRFVARRGKCSYLWSDQGRNFVGANKELVTAWKEAKVDFSGEIADSLLSDKTEWHFNPPYSPNYGGLWEAGVKSIKYHLKRILTTHLTFEEFTTVLCEIEACLNSRPLSPLDDSEATQPLTPGHFLIGEAPNLIPSPSLLNIKVSNLTRWQYTQKLLNDFWHRWQQEYLSRLQQRPKWLKKQEEFNLGQIVLIKNEMLPPGKWALGRIVEKHPGGDGVTRVYSVKCGNNIIKRSISKLCYFPISDDDIL